MSEEKNQKIIKIELKHPLPHVGVSLNSQFDIISAYVIATNNGEKNVNWKELGPYLKIDPHVVSGCNKFFQHLGLIKSSEKSRKYISTKLAHDLHNAHKSKNNELMKSTLRKILESSWFWIQTKQYLDVNDSTSKDELVQKLCIGCGANSKKHMPALKKLIEYMQSADLIKENNNRFELNAKLTTNIENQGTEQMQSAELKPENNFNRSNKNITPIHSDSINVSFGLLIDPQITEEQIRKTIQIVWDELQKISKISDDND